MEIVYYFDELQIARVTSLHKAGPTFEMRNYRPISILPSFNKIVEIILKNQLVAFWNKHNVFAPHSLDFGKTIAQH